MCGEKPHAGLFRCQQRGSPPRVRGKGTAAGCAAVGRGITPACAGKRLCPTEMQGEHKDHPRVCGEKADCTRRACRCIGSPPRVRGKVGVRLHRVRVLRITPACAGKRFPKPTAWKATKDHPRVCGEKPSIRGGASSGIGSPPRVRGKAIWTMKISDVDRITPACAGKSSDLHCILRWH